jgi:hypothetical protein
MKSTQKKIKVPFHFTANDNFLMFGIISPEPDYKLSLLINKSLNISLTNHSPLEVKDDKGNLISFSKFSDHTESPDTIYNLFTNKSGNSYLLKKLKTYDYLFLIQDADDNFSSEMLTQKLKESGIFRAVFVIDTNKVNDKYLQYLIP